MCQFNRETADDAGAMVYTKYPVSRALAAHGVDVWTIDLDRSDAEQKSCAQVLSKDELARAEAFRVATARRAFLVARHSLRSILAEYVRCEPSTVCFVYGKFGKPQLSPSHHSTDLTFNLSHSSDVAVLAIGRGRRIGADVELIRAVPEAEGIAARYFAPGERSLLAATAAPQYQKSFFQIWTHKEAVLKATGEGIGRGLSELDIGNHLSPARADECRTHFADANWMISELSLGESYVGAVAVEV